MTIIKIINLTSPFYMYTIFTKIINELDRRNVSMNPDSIMSSDVRHLFDGYGFFQRYPLDPDDNSERIHNLFVSCKAAGINWEDCASKEFYFLLLSLLADRDNSFNLNLRLTFF